MARKFPWRSNGAQRIGRGAAAVAVVGVAAALLLASGTRHAAHARATPALAGATLAPIGDPALLVVTSLRSDGAAAASGLRVGDTIVAADGHPRPSLATLADERERRAGRSIDLRVRRGADVVDVPLLGGGEGDGDGAAHPAGRGR